MQRETRQSVINEIISKNIIETQDDLSEELKKRGFDVTQATISRDIKEMGLIKILAENNKYKYTVLKKEDGKISSRLLNLFKEAVLSVAVAKNIVVIKTLAASASTAASVIDQMPITEILGSIAGDDTIIIIVDSDENACKVKDRFQSMIR